MNPTCSTCEHWCNGPFEGSDIRAEYVKNQWRASCGKADVFHEMADICLGGDACVDTFEFDTPPEFGCTLHKPVEVVR